MQHSRPMAIPDALWWFSFCWVLWMKQKVSKDVNTKCSPTGTQWHNFQSPTLTLSAKMPTSQTEGQTDGQTVIGMMLTANPKV